ncbi:MAG TPA: bifunctional phosphopantothenoylcysteine decarboxylase/phosphopantothenate--cysteine ligase CoaBC [Candidatus Polarisedimenticolia bacterium]|nr:bifunctional phosphopantothenoylcysteine decarboxylase/phosphopantothenate--cysteine ligase CoaBC [Candidatus Polarisedimenticolia bacterium]
MPRVVLGICGGIAAYKAAEIVRALVREGADVTVILTANAARFVTPLTLRTLSGRRVITSAFEPPDDGPDVEHVGLARDCEVLLVAPATANVLAKMAAGIADDFLTTFCLGVTCPVIVAPAMNTRMWGHPAVRSNVATLASRGVQVIPPAEGPLASAGEGSGVGRLPEPALLAAAALSRVREAGGRRGALAGRTVLITAGPTREEIDPVRFLSNPSTGKMGYAVAGAARDQGARVILVSGPTHLPDPPGVEMVRVVSAQQMHDAVLARLEEADIVVKAAAVSDFRPARREASKVKKDAAALELRLERTPDILAEIGRRKGRRFVVGFAAETDDVVENARRKLDGKGLDLIVANRVGDGNGFAGDDNQAVLIGPGLHEELPRLSKAALAERIVALVAGRVR